MYNRGVLMSGGLGASPKDLPLNLTVPGTAAQS